MSSKVLERSDHNRVLSGVFGGLGEYLNVDPNLLRIVGVVLLIVAPLVMVIVYTAAAFLLPRKGGAAFVSGSFDMAKVGPAVVGLVLIVIGSGLMGGSPITFFGFPFFAAALTWMAGFILALLGVAVLITQLKKI
ncbi:MAG: PspC domain-containing protein [Candidatus Caldarchaeum sp.]